MEKILTTIYKSPVGELILGAFQGRLCLCDWYYRRMRKAVDERIQKGLNADFLNFDLDSEKKSPTSATDKDIRPKNIEVIQKAIEQLEDYFSGNRKTFDVPISMVGTDFQQSVWQELMEIPFGETRSYFELSQQMGNPDAIRAVASANGANAISIIIPCHRIIGSDGSLVGYAGGLDAKKRLLRLEGAKNNKNRDQTELFN
ncbi:methylated-DNA--[protein]-cysteine S-methyltransferase [Algoriphagus formosus]|uniref:Methylated-DNA--protein-cysteine methyltransferase n=1 Tax=Algoriphagus formosus TaxID=2007308 RepID=A0A4R5VFG8_9BACT|nr:methylated-DNA--[protein]-cysteine S-methyltransferase [Algoriphagus aquimaris]TDK51039.1 methylated-DNA--[protein]-cysteine S-methyltransferase [Algoriphagus aquimaris]